MENVDGTAGSGMNLLIEEGYFEEVRKPAKKYASILHCRFLISIHI